MRKALVYWLVPFALWAETRVLRVSPAPGTKFQLEVEKTGLMRGKKHLFLFERYTGKLTMDVQMPERSKMELEIESRSAVLKDDWVSDKDAKKIMEMAQMDMMDAAKYPLMKFVSKSVVPGANGHFTVSGDLTIRNITNPVTIGLVAKPGDLFEGSARVKLTDYKLKPPAAALGAIGTKDEMLVSFLLKAGS